MKIYNWIDSFFNTYEKRSSIFVVVAVVWLMIQNIWQTVFMVDVLRLDTIYELLDFSGQLNRYTNSYIMYTIMNLIEMNSLSFLMFCKCLLVQLNGFEWILIILSLIRFVNSKHKWKWSFLIGMHGVLFISMLLFVDFGMHASTLEGVLYCLKWMGTCGLLLELVILFNSLYILIQYTFRLL